MSQTIQISEMEQVIMDALEQYADKASEVISEALPEVGKSTAAELRATSPKRTGDYAKSWKFDMKQSRGSKKKNKLVVYNKDHYRIAHLLENGHANRNGGRTEGIPHVKPAADKAEKEAIDKITQKLENISV